MFYKYQHLTDRLSTAGKRKYTILCPPPAAGDSTAGGIVLSTGMTSIL